MFAGSFVVIKALYDMNENITFVDHCITKSIPPVFIYYFIAKKQGVNLFKMSNQTALLLLCRVVFGVSAMGLITFSINYISVSINTIITNLSPIYVAILSFLLLKERISTIEVILMFLGFFGIYLIAIDKPADEADESNYFIGVVCNVFASLIMSVGYICLRKINTTNSSLYSPFYFFIGGICLSILMMCYSYEFVPKVWTYTWVQVLLFF